MNVAEMFGSMGIVGLTVMVCLVALSVYSVTVIFDKFRRFRASANESAMFMPAYATCLKEGKLKDVKHMAERHRKSHVARVVGAGMEELADSGNANGDPSSRVEMLSRALERSTAKTLADMKKGLGALATIGSTAPFIGLFGTVVGIVHAFKGIAESGSGGVAAVSGGIAEALIATALGILVAIPAVMAFNYFVSTLERFHVEMDTTAAELVDYCQKRMKAPNAPNRSVA
jgi:biopolymer transport protein ExbB/biopolymer transport protein TolQ